LAGSLLSFLLSFFGLSLEAFGADSNFFTINGFSLKIQFLAADGFNVRVTAPMTLQRFSTTDITVCHNGASIAGAF
jgi:hypothetical protein